MSRKRSHCEESKAPRDGTAGAEWVTEKTTQASHPLVRLHNEILDFCTYAVPKGSEIADREKAIKRQAPAG